MVDMHIGKCSLVVEPDALLLAVMNKEVILGMGLSISMDTNLMRSHPLGREICMYS